MKNRKQKQQEQITLKQAFGDYLNARKTLKTRTRTDSERTANPALTRTDETCSSGNSYDLTINNI